MNGFIVLPLSLLSVVLAEKVHTRISDGFLFPMLFFLFHPPRGVATSNDVCSGVQCLASQYVSHATFNKC